MVLMVVSGLLVEMVGSDLDVSASEFFGGTMISDEIIDDVGTSCGLVEMKMGG